MHNIPLSFKADQRFSNFHDIFRNSIFAVYIINEYVFGLRTVCL